MLIPLKGCLILQLFQIDFVQCSIGIIFNMTQFRLMSFELKLDYIGFNSLLANQLGIGSTVDHLHIRRRILFI